MSEIKVNDEYIIKKVRKKNCSDVKIYSKSSKLAQKKNKEGHQFWKFETKTQPVLSEIEKRTLKYRFNIKNIQSLKFHGTIDQSEYITLERLIRAKHKSKTLNNYSFTTFRKYIKNNNTQKINSILNTSI